MSRYRSNKHQKYIWVPKKPIKKIFIPDDIWHNIFLQMQITILLDLMYVSKIFYRKIQKFNWKDYLEYHHITRLIDNNTFISTYAKYIAKSKNDMKSWFGFHEKFMKYYQEFIDGATDLYMILIGCETIKITFTSEGIMINRCHYGSYYTSFNHIYRESPEISIKKILSTYQINILI